MDDVSEISEKLEKSLSVDAEDRMGAYHRFIEDGKDVARQGDLHKALELFRLAYNIRPSEKLESRIKKIEELVQNDSENEDEFVNVSNSGLMLFKELHDNLYSYQRDGVAFLYKLCRDGRKGGILADDMGLGKTIQVISFLSGMYDAELVKHALLVMPTSLITNWIKEFAKWTPGMRVKEFHGSSKTERSRNLQKIQRRGGVAITTYSMLINNWQELSSYHGREFTWDYMILDEAHKIKTTTTKTAKSAYAIPAKNRVLLTGTPVQNNLREMWALFDFACQGTLLSSAKTFKTEYENPITRAREKDATPGEKALGARMSENLMTIIKPYFLRRTKAEVQRRKLKGTQQGKDPNDQNKQVPNPQKDEGAAMPTLTRKNELIVWTYLSAVQESIYRQFISLDHIKELLMTTRSPLAELNILKKLCDHPRLLSAGAISKLGLKESAAESQHEGDGDLATHSIAGVPDDTLISESGKLVFLFALLERLREEGHRTLVFAHYRKVLDIIERILTNRGFRVLRLDGTITQLSERERLISLFQTDTRYSVFLLTTQVGGVGITLTAANRVVIYDPSWNPATDAQAVDRAYRVGQTENVVIYRLITCGTVEEKIYRRQVFKDSLIRQNTGDMKNPFRYFSKQELKELFTLEHTRSSSTQIQLQDLHSRHRRTDPELDEHIAHLHTMEMFGISDHDLMFSVDVNHDEGPEDQEEHHYIEGRVQKAQELMKAESELQMQLAESLSSSTERAWLRQPMDDSKDRSHEKKPRNPQPSQTSTHNYHNVNGSPVLVELDQSGSGQENQPETNGLIDLTKAESTTEEMMFDVSQESLSNLNLDCHEGQPASPEKSELVPADISQAVVEDSLVSEVSAAEAADGMDVSAPKVSEELWVTSGDSITSSANGSCAFTTAMDENDQLPNETSHSKCDSKTEVVQPSVGVLQNKRVSVLQQSNTSFKVNSPSRGGAGTESLEGNFNLQLEDSDMFSDQDLVDHQETEAQEEKLLSQLQVDGSFDVDKSLCGSRATERLEQSRNSRAFEVDESIDDSIVTTKKKRAAVIYDSKEEDDDRQQENRQLGDSLQALGASTPKSALPASSPLRLRTSVGGNISVASRHSLVQSLIEDLDSGSRHDVDEEDGVSEGFSDGAAGVNGSSHDELEESAGETLNTEEEMSEDDEDAESAELVDESMSGQEASGLHEESTEELELASTERMDQCAAAAVLDVAEAEPASEAEDRDYESLVRRGKECYSGGNLDQALSFFLRAIDIRSGDPEIQLMTIQLYRQLSQRTF